MTEKACEDRGPRNPAKSVGSAGPAGSLWFIGWLFTIGYAKLGWWKILLGAVAWPYLLGSALR